jgi:hypothetical protein
VFLLLIVDAVLTLRRAQDVLRLQLIYAVIVACAWEYTALLEADGLSLLTLHKSDVPGALIGIAFVGGLVRGKHWRWLHLFVIASLLVSTSAGSMLAGLGGLAVSLIFSARPGGRASGSCCSLR